MSTSRQDQINADLQSFRQNPVEFMNRLPPKYDRQRNQVVSGTTLFDRAAIEDKKYVQARDELRQQLTRLGESAPIFYAAITENDRADQLVDTYRYFELQSMENDGLMSAELDEHPWSDFYWATYAGSLGFRYADPKFPDSPDWKKNFDYIQYNPAGTILASRDTAAIDLLSPSEKYDALIGDVDQSLTKQMWQEGRNYSDTYGIVETWMGICDGWSSAAYMLPRPTGTARVLAADGVTYITFYPSDIKALASLLWAKIRGETRFIGGRCKDKYSESDPRTGRRIESADCFDTNPGTWHLAVVNQIGVSKRSMVMDATFDYEVWNQPILSYEYTYFNPKTLTSTNSLSAATVAMANFKNDDILRNYRSNETHSIVGIAMDVSYVEETTPTHNDLDSADNDRVRPVRYYYDLELDKGDNIIGGEWYKNAHPDFLWTPVKGSRALAPGEPCPGSWERNQPIPEQWRQLASMTATHYKAPLNMIVERLIEFANS